MRSIHTTKEGNQAKRDYYTKDKSLGQGQASGKKAYYGKGEAQSINAAMTEAVWFGKDAERLRLVGHTHQSDFEQIYDGFISGTNERIRFEKPRSDHEQNCLYDLVLSCKKSVSMQIHLGKDDRLYQAYQETVVEIAQLIEKDYAQARQQVNGERRVIQTEGIIAVLMPHHTTRELDMGVHTHLLIANGTYCKDGKWRSLRDVGFSHAYYLGDYFSARLAARVQELGYEIRETVTEQGHPSWELAGYTDEQIKVFSKRSEDVEVKKLIAAGYSRDDALLVTRKAKEVDETIEEMQERWGKEAQTHNIEAIVPSDRPIRAKQKTTAEDVLESAIRHYSHNSVHFSRDQIREYAFKLNRPFNVMQLDQAIAAHPELIDYSKLGKLEDFQGHFTTAKALEREIRTIKGWMQGQGKATPVMERSLSAQALAQVGGHPLKSGQRAAVIGVLASVNQHQCIHGLSGVGKTSALKALKTLMDSRGIEIIGLAPSIPAAQKLGEELGIETQTVQKFIRSDLELKRGQFLVIDESGMDSADMLDVVMQKANAVGARVLLVGDTGQNQAIEAGSPMRSVMSHGAEVHHIAEIIRQQNEVQRRAVELIAAGHGLDALSLLSEHDYVTQIEDRDLRISSIAAEYLKLSVKEQGKTLIVTGTNAEKDAITSEIRAGLKAAGLLGESVKVTQLRDRALTPEQTAEVLFYRVGDYVSLSRNYKTTGLQKDTPYQVMAKDGNELILASAGGRLYRFNPKHYKDKKVFSAHKFDLAIGDSLRWTTTNREQGQINGHTFKVFAIKGQVAIATTAKGEEFFIDLSRPLTVDYTLCSTSYRAQGSDRPRVLVSATNDPTSNREPFYVSISRQIKQLKVWTDSYEGLKRRVVESSVQRNPIELLFGDPYGNSPVSGDNATAQAAIEPDAGATAAESGNAVTAQQHHEHHPDSSQGRDGLIPDGVRGATGEPEAVRDSRRDSGIDGDIEGVEGPIDELGTDTRRHDLPGELRDGGNQELRSEVAQQRLAQSAAELRSRMARVISSLTVLGNDELVQDSGIVEGTREVVEALEPIVSSLEGQPVAPPPKRDLSAAMARVINGLTAVDSEKVFGDSEIIAEIKSLVSRVEAHAIAQEQLTKLGEHHVQQNSSSESPRTTARKDSGVEHNGREYGQSRRDSESERITADIAASLGESDDISRTEDDASDYARPHAGADQAATQTNRGQEREFAHRQGEPGYRRGTASDRETEYRDVATQSRTARSESGIGESAARVTSSTAADFGLSHDLAGTTDPLQALADAIVRIRLQRELAGPLAQYRSTLRELREVLKQNAQLQADIQQKSVTYTETQANVREVKAAVAQKQATVADKLQEVLNQAKIEVLDTTLTEWRSLRQEPELLQIPELAVAPSEVAELTSLIENYPAQKVIEYAMAEYYQSTEQVIETKSTLKAETPGFRVEQQSDGKSELDESINRVPRTRDFGKSANKPRISRQSTAPPGQTSAKPKVRTQRPPTPKPVKAVPIVAFWQPDYTEALRLHLLEPHHWEEFKLSAIHPDIIAARFESVEGKSVFDRLFSDKFATMGAGQKSNRAMERMMDEFAQVAEGAWWYKAGKKVLDFPALAAGQKPEVSTGGSLKPDEEKRRVDIKKTAKKRALDPNVPTEYIKYENPVGPKQTLFERDLFFADVPDEIAQGIYRKYGVTPSTEEIAAGFWYVVYKHVEIPIYRVEGAKKDAALTSQGRVVIGGHGINAGYRANDLQGNKLERRLLHPQLEIFAQPGREFRFANDQDESVTTILNVRRDTVRESELLEERGSTTLNIKWDGTNQRKGVDDLIAKDGPLAFERADQKAYPMEREANIHYRTQYNTLAREVRKAKPGISGEALDIEVYLLAITKGKPKDGERFLSQSDHARSLKDPEAVAAYIEHIKAAAPEYLRQQNDPRHQYEMLLWEVVPLNLNPNHVDAAVHQLATSRGLNADRILTHSDTALKLPHPELLPKYLQRLKVLSSRLTLPVRPEPPRQVQPIAEQVKTQVQIQTPIKQIRRGR